MAIDVYQIDYAPGLPCPAEFRRYDCAKIPAWDKREIAHIQRFYSEGRHLQSNFSGLVSPKFPDKTRVTARKFIEFIEANPGYDVYFINPFPHLAYLTFNVWEQGEVWHPGLCQLSNALFAAADWDVDTLNCPRNTASTLLYSNYWVGNPSFWDKFVAVITNLMGAVDLLPPNDREKFFSIAAHPTTATYYPFVFERVFSTFLLNEASGLRFLAYPWSRDEVIGKCETRAQKLVVSEWAEMIDRWDDANNYTEDQRTIFRTLASLRRSSSGEPTIRSSSQHLYSELVNRASSLFPKR